MTDSRLLKFGVGIPALRVLSGRKARHANRLPIPPMDPVEWRKEMPPGVRLQLGLLFAGHCENLPRLEVVLWFNLLHRQGGEARFTLRQLVSWTKASKGSVTTALGNLARRNLVVNIGGGKRRLAVMPHTGLWQLESTPGVSPQGGKWVVGNGGVGRGAVPLGRFCPSEPKVLPQRTTWGDIGGL